jgi:hypothetical protein
MLLTLIDATSFPGRFWEYSFPAALVLTTMAVWLLAEGIRLLVGALRRDHLGSPSGTGLDNPG